MAILAECPICHRQQSLNNKRCKACGEDLDQAKKSQRVRYWIQYRLPGGKQKKELVKGEDINPFSIIDARAFHSKRIVQKRENRIFDVKLDSKATFKEFADWYLNLEKVKGLASYRVINIYLKKFNTQFGDMVISDIMPSDLENYQVRRKKEGSRDASIDREVGVVKTMISKAFDHGMISGDTLRVFKSVKKVLKRNSNARNRIVSKTEYENLLTHAPYYLKNIIATAYHTGMRKAEILNLTWDKVDLKNYCIRLSATDTKDREPRFIPICDELYKRLKAIPKALHDRHIFLYQGYGVKDIKRAFIDTCKKAKIPYGRNEINGLTFHDLRRTFNTNMRKAGVPESVIMKITGHSTHEMFDRYNYIDEQDARDAVNKMVNVTKTLPKRRGRKAK